jgi:hypothetical protein
VRQNIYKVLKQNRDIKETVEVQGEIKEDINAILQTYGIVAAVGMKMKTKLKSQIMMNTV